KMLPEPKGGETPRFVFYATSLQTASSVRIGRKYLADYKVGMIENPDLKLSKVVAASSAFPPVLSPVEFKFDNTSVWKPLTGAHLYHNEALKRCLTLTDGGVYDNMGLEAIWNRCETGLVSDAGGPLEVEHVPVGDAIGQ